MPDPEADEEFQNYAAIVEAMHHDFEVADRDSARAVDMAEKALEAARRWNAAS